jgi:predicted dienelactone hydrolase
MRRTFIFLTVLSLTLAAMAWSDNASLQTAASQARYEDIAGLKVSVWKPTTSGPAPLIIFSHGLHATSRQSTFLMKALADHGYLVLAPNHKDSPVNQGNKIPPPIPLIEPRQWSDSTYKDRADDINALLKALKDDPQWSSQIDWDRVGLAGHSLGGYTVLGLVGGWPSWTMGNIKAVLAMSPYSMPFSVHQTLGNVHVPVMYQGGSDDIGITPFVARPGGGYDQTPSPAYFVDFKGADHLSWTQLEMGYKDDIIHYSLAFFDKYLKGDKSADLTTKLPNVDDLRSK